MNSGKHHPRGSRVLLVLAMLLCCRTAGFAESLEDAWSAALSADQGLQAERWRVSAAGRGLAAARAERFLTASLDASYTVRDKDSAFRFDFPPQPPPLSLPERLNYQQREGAGAGVDVVQPLYTSGRINRSVAAAGAAVTAAQAARTITTLDVKMRVAEAYVAVLQATRTLEVAQQNLDNLTAHALVARSRLAQGRVTRNESLAAEVASADARQRLIKARNRLSSARTAYNRVVGRPLDAPVELDEPPPVFEDYDLEEMTFRARTQRPEFVLLDARIRALRHQAAGVLAANRPQVNVQGTFRYQENRFVATPALAGVGVNLEWVPFDGGRGRNQAARLMQSAEALVREREDTESLIELEVHQAWLELETTRERIHVAREALEQAEENLRVTKNLYDQGRAVHTEVLDAEGLRRQSYSNFYDSIYEAVLASLRLRRAAGEL